MLRATVRFAARERQEGRGLSTAGLATLVLGLLTCPARALDIYQWEWVDPTDLSKGIRQSSKLCKGVSVYDHCGEIRVYGDLTRAHLPGADLTHLGFYQAKLNSANLTRANLSGVGLVEADLTAAFLGGANLSGADLTSTKLTNASLAYANLTGANLSRADLSNADFSNAQVAGARFETGGRGVSAAQLYSTASYQAGDLHGVAVSGSMSNWNLANQDLTAADLHSASLTNADLRDALIAQANLGDNLSTVQFYSTASYKAKDLHGITISGSLSGWNLASQNLTGADLHSASLTNANLTNALIAEANLGADKISLYQLYTTASHKAKDLHGITLGGNCAGGILVGQNLAGANLSGADLTYANLDGANLARATLSRSTLTRAQLNDANLTDAKLEDANMQSAQLQNSILKRAQLSNVNLDQANLAGADLRYVNLSSASLNATNLNNADLRGGQVVFAASTLIANTIRPNGTITGLRLTKGQNLTIRDYANDEPMPRTAIKVRTSATVDPSGTLRLLLNDTTWDSIISFDAGIPVTLGGNLELACAPGVDPVAWMGHSFKLFDWTGVEPTGQFNVVSQNNLTWDTSQLYTTGFVTLVPEPAAAALLALGGLTLLQRRRDTLRAN